MKEANTFQECFGQWVFVGVVKTGCIICRTQGKKMGGSLFNNGEEFQAGDEQSFRLSWAFLIRERAGLDSWAGCCCELDPAGFCAGCVLAGGAVTWVQMVVVLVCVNFFSSQVR